MRAAARQRDRRRRTGFLGSYIQRRCAGRVRPRCHASAVIIRGHGYWKVKIDCVAPLREVLLIGETAERAPPVAGGLFLVLEVAAFDGVHVRLYRRCRQRGYGLPLSFARVPEGAHLCMGERPGAGDVASAP